MQQMRLKPVRRLPFAFGWLTKRGDEVSRRWLNSLLTQPEIRRDTVRVLRAIAAEPDLLERAADALPGFDRPALIVWAAEDRVMPPEHGRRLAGLLPQSRLMEVADSYTLIPLDQPAPLARAVPGAHARDGISASRGVIQSASASAWRMPDASWIAAPARCLRPSWETGQAVITYVAPASSGASSPAVMVASTLRLPGGTHAKPDGQSSAAQT
jgi:alpha/beta hydrolase fold